MLQWRRGMPARAAGCETDEQGLSVLGLAVERRWPEIDDLEKRGAEMKDMRIWWSSANPLEAHIILVSPRSERLGPSTLNSLHSSFIRI